MKKNWIFFFFILLCSHSFAQQKIPDKTNKMVWEKGCRFSLVVGQAGSKNWASGNDVFSISANSFLTAFANAQKGK
jgi:hypothetical protein